MGQMRRRGSVVLTAVALAGSAWSIASTWPAGTAAAGDSAACDLPLGDQDHHEADGALVVMVDGTVSSENESDRVGDLVDFVEATTDDATYVLSVGSFGGSDDEVRYSDCFDGTVFVPDGNNARTRARNRPELIEGLEAGLAGLHNGYEASDPTSALRAGIRRLDGVEGSRLLVIHTDGIATAGCAALPEQVNVDDPGLIDSLVSACVDAGQLPPGDGIEIVIAGIGRTDQDLDAPSVSFLIDLNTALCKATGATCRVDPNLPAGD